MFSSVTMAATLRSGNRQLTSDADKVQAEQDRSQQCAKHSSERDH